ncbi:MAG: TetR/AcrR family transcriptional regulator [Dehalococcoidia bacterium]
MTTDALPGAPPADGRTARAERTRVAVAEAMLDLLGEGDLRPTAQRVAERADVSLRTVFHHYQDMESLLATAADRQFARMMAMARPVPRIGSLDGRIEAFVTSRGRLQEAISPVRRAGLLSEPFSAVIASRLRWIRGRGRLEVERVFAPELSARPAVARRELLEALTAASSWSAWETLRAHQRLSFAGARKVMARTLRALLKEE